MEKKCVQADNNEGLVELTRKLMHVSMAFVLLSIGCIVCGALTIVYNAEGDIWQWPFTSGSGLWTGVVVLWLGMTGVIAMSSFDENDLPKTYRLMYWFKVFLTVSVSVSSQHTVYSGIGVGICASVVGKWVGTLQSNQLWVQALNLSFGIIILLLTIGTLVYPKYNRSLYMLLGRKRNRCGC